MTVTVVRYNSVYPMANNNGGNNYYYNPFGGFFGGFGGYGNYGSNYSSNSNTDLVVGGGYDFVTADVVLELPQDTEN